MPRYNKIFAGPTHKTLPQVKEAPAAVDLLPGSVVVVNGAGKFALATAAAAGRVYVVQDNYLTLKGVDDVVEADETAIGIELMDEFFINVRVPTATNIAKDAALGINASGKVVPAVAGGRVIGYADEAFNNTSGADQLVRMRPANTRLATA